MDKIFVIFRANGKLDTVDITPLGIYSTQEKAEAELRTQAQDWGLDTSKDFRDKKGYLYFGGMEEALYIEHHTINSLF